MQKSTFLLSLLLMLPVAGSVCFSQESSSQPSREPSAESRATPTPGPENRKRRSVAEVEDAMSKGEELLFRKHDARASLEEFKRAIRLDPFYVQGYMLLGLAQMQLGQWNEAQWAFEEAAKVEPENARAYLGAGSALNEQKSFTAAQKALERSLELRPDSAEAHYELARSLWGLGKWQAAELHVRRAIELNKDYAGPHALLGNIHIQREDPQAALKEFEEYLRLDPEGNLAPSVRQIIAQLRKALGK
jgi:tetratricopeptide (TPR) repeat protein